MQIDGHLYCSPIYSYRARYSIYLATEKPQLIKLIHISFVANMDQQEQVEYRSSQQNQEDLTLLCVML